ncbi:hypothetical protein ACN38_g10892 [Penicillium nordicum]|uniref:Uncharacterized protein n=1 Tax=Penicillium nordicum TaxID=229535 RepID=A0A0M8P147_9EURO|nr:hypothetical protein ACN38_g10892 [Penicillium nordicum]
MGSGESYKQWAILSSRSGKKHPIFFSSIFCIFFLIFCISFSFFFLFFFIFSSILFTPLGNKQEPNRQT